MKLKVRPSGPQVRGASFLVQRNRGFVCFATGSGKSLLEILVGMRLIADGKMDKYIIVGTLSSMIEIEADFLKLTTIVPFKITDMGSLQEFVHGGSKFGVMMYGALTSMVTAWEDKPFKLGEEAGEKRVPDLGKLNQVALLLRECRIGVSFDEYHTLKNPEAFLTRCFRVLLPYFSHVYGATATALMSKVYDLFHLVTLMDPKVFGSKRNFEDSYLVRRRKRVGRREIWEIVSFKRLDELNKALSDIVINHFPVRELNFSRRMTPLDNESDYYKAAEGVFGEKDATGRVKAHSARLIDLQMVVNRSENKKRELLKVLAERIHQGVLLYCSFYESVDIVAKILGDVGISYREINGKMDGPARKASKDWFIENPANKVLLITRAGGQCFAKGTRILLHSGRVKEVQDVVVGDLLMGPDSLPRRVESLAGGRAQMYSVSSPGEKPYVVNGSHMLSLRLGSNYRKGQKKGDQVVLTVDDYLKSGKWFKEISRGWRSGVNFSEKELPIPPYILGLWLGDGCRRTTSLWVRDGEEAIVEEWLDYGKSIGLELDVKGQEGCKKYELTTRLVGLPTSNRMLLALRGLKLYLNKHIPHLYGTASREQRLELLAGLIDTDGSLHNGCGVEVTQSLRVMADGLVSLARSLGFDSRWSYSERPYKKGDPMKGRYRVSIAGDLTEVPTRLVHKRAGLRKSPKNHLWSRVGVSPVGEGDYYGFEVSGADRLFLLADYTVVHNSLNLQATPTIVFYDIPFGVGYFIQIMGRVVREFSAFKEFNIEFVVVEGTIDEYKFEIISANRELFEQIFCNTMIPESEQMDSFSGEIINRLRKQLLWRKRNK